MSRNQIQSKQQIHKPQSSQQVHSHHQKAEQHKDQQTQSKQILNNQEEEGDANSDFNDGEEIEYSRVVKQRFEWEVKSSNREKENNFYSNNNTLSNYNVFLSQNPLKKSNNIFMLALDEKRE